MAEDPRPAGEPQVQPISWVSTQVPLDLLVSKLKEPKDVRVAVFSAGMVAAVCKACQEQIQPADKDGLLWLVCPKCKKVSFLVLANLPRDFKLAERDGGVFEYEVFYQQDLPPGLSPPAS